jgi:8-oxo-dGTP pyrophosphatase MutT (NUDIX family)
MINTTDVAVGLSSWQAPDADQTMLQAQYLEFLATHPDGIWRECHDGHLTASALVMAESMDQVLLTLHPKVGRWLQLGGHCEQGDHSLQAAARREVIEECGIAPTWLSDHPLRLDRHPVPCGGRMSEHLDVQYLALVPTDALAVCSAESLDLRWFDLTKLPSDLDGSVQALISAARHR